MEVNPNTGVPYVEGDFVAQFAPLVGGVELLDYVSDSTWIDNYASGTGDSILQRFFRFLLRVDIAAFNLPALLFAKEFVLKVKPTYTYPIFSVLAEVEGTSIDVSDSQAFDAVFSVFDTPKTNHNMARIWDQPEDGHASVTKNPAMSAMGSIWKNSYDCRQYADGPAVDWGYDKPAPEEEIVAQMCSNWAGGLPQHDHPLFAWDCTLYDPLDPNTPISWAYDVELAADYYCRDKVI